MAEVRKVEIAGKSYPFYFGMNAINIYDKASGGNFFEDMSKIDFSGNKIGIDSNLIVSIAYAGIRDGHRLLGEKFEMQKEDVADLFDEDIMAIQNIFTELMEFGVFKQQVKAPRSVGSSAKKK